MSNAGNAHLKHLKESRARKQAAPHSSALSSPLLDGFKPSAKPSEDVVALTKGQLPREPSTASPGDWAPSPAEGFPSSPTRHIHPTSNEGEAGSLDAKDGPDLTPITLPSPSFSPVQAKLPTASKSRTVANSCDHRSTAFPVKHTPPPLTVTAPKSTSGLPPSGRSSGRLSRRQAASKASTQANPVDAVHVPAKQPVTKETEADVTKQPARAATMPTEARAMPIKARGDDPQNCASVPKKPKSTRSMISAKKMAVVPSKLVAASSGAGRATAASGACPQHTRIDIY